MWPAIIGGVSGLATGVLGAILAPWAKWRVDREQATRTWRRERLTEWRAGLAEAERLPDALQDRDFSAPALVRLPQTTPERRGQAEARVHAGRSGPFTIIVTVWVSSIGTSLRGCWRTASMPCAHKTELD